VWLRRTGGCICAYRGGSFPIAQFVRTVCVRVCRKTAVGVEKWLARKVARLPRRVAESTPRPKGRWVCEARRHALPACGSDPTPSTFQRLTLPVGFENGREREREGGAGAPRRTGRMNREGEVCSLVTCGVHFGARRRASARRRCVPRQLRLSVRSSECCGTREQQVSTAINHW